MNETYFYAIDNYTLWFILQRKRQPIKANSKIKGSAIIRYLENKFTKQLDGKFLNDNSDAQAKLKEDSMELDQVLVDALKIADQNKDLNPFHHQYEVSSPSHTKVDINLDNHFSTNSPHLIIHRISPDAVYIDVYAKKR